MKCIKCGSDMVPKRGENTICEFCKSIYTETEIRLIENNIKGVYELTKGTTELERLIGNAEAFLGMERYEKARKTFEQICSEFPQDYRGWWGIVRSETEKLSDYLLEETTIRELGLEKYVQDAKFVAPGEIKEKIEEFWNEYCLNCKKEQERIRKEKADKEEQKRKEAEEKAEQARIAAERKVEEDRIRKQEALKRQSEVEAEKKHQKKLQIERKRLELPYVFL